MEIHVVKSGESLYSIARQYGVDPLRLAAENGFPLERTLVVGQTVVIQFPEIIHVVGAGETLTSIARQYAVSTATLYRNNFFLMGRSTIRADEVLVISYFNEPLGAYEVSGYAYPYIDGALLRSTLPYLTYLTPFTYGITRSGGLLPIADEWMLAMAKDYGTSALLHLSTVTEQGTFSNSRSTLLLTNPILQRQLAQEVLETIRQKGYAGLDIDFEYVLPEEREQYAEFVALLRRTLHPEGYSVTVALAPKTSADQKGLLYEAHDYALLGQAADKVFLMTYEWGYTYGPPMAVAPLPNVRQVLDYALTVIPADKITLGIPNYGYDWPLPYIQGHTKARSLSNVQAVDLARRHGAEISFDESAQAPWFRYRDDGGRLHEVWFEDARSMDAKLRLASERRLLGVGYWNLDRPYPQNWAVLNALYQIK